MNIVNRIKRGKVVKMITDYNDYIRIPFWEVLLRLLQGQRWFLLGFLSGKHAKLVFATSLPPFPLSWQSHHWLQVPMMFGQ